MPSTSHWHGRRVLVTGCTGLIGSAAVRELLARGAAVVGLVRDRVAEPEARREPSSRTSSRPGRVEDRGRVQTALAVHDIQAVFHLAGPTDGADPATAPPRVTAVRDHDRGCPSSPPGRCRQRPDCATPTTPARAVGRRRVRRGVRRRRPRDLPRRPGRVVALLTATAAPRGTPRPPRPSTPPTPPAPAWPWPRPWPTAGSPGRPRWPSGTARRLDRDLAAAVQAIVAGAASLPAPAADPPDAPLGSVPQLCRPRRRTRPWRGTATSYAPASSAPAQSSRRTARRPDLSHPEARLA